MFYDRRMISAVFLMKQFPCVFLYHRRDLFGGVMGIVEFQMGERIEQTALCEVESGEDITDTVRIRQGIDLVVDVLTGFFEG